MTNKTGILEYYGRTHTGFLHAYGKRATEKLIAAADVRDGDTLLEIGFGTGATLAELAAINKTLKLYGAEKSQLMKQVAMSRLSFCGIRNVELKCIADDGKIPFDDAIFDKIYIESVLGILNDRDLEFTLTEIYRLLKPGGKLLVNETIWLPSTGKEIIAEINACCLEMFGIIQSNGSYAYPDDWKDLFQKQGFRLLQFNSLHDMAHQSKKNQSPLRSLRSTLFTWAGKLRGRFDLTLRKERRQYNEFMKSITQGQQLMDGFLIVAEKPVSF